MRNLLLDFIINSFFKSDLQIQNEPEHLRTS